MFILGIESSCDETAAAVLRDGKIILSNIVASQVAVHKKYGGVVPELASRNHLENIIPTVNTAFREAGITPQDIQGIAVTQGPGLVGSLLVGVNYAKALCFALKQPLVAINHLEGHIYSVPLEIARLEQRRQVSYTDWNTLCPAIALVASGGHTSLFWVKHIGGGEQGKGSYKLIGRTRDDAAGEAFDKVAKLLHLGYPGGPTIDRLAQKGDPRSIDFPVAKISDGKLDFSFSGIKTAVLRHLQNHLQTEMAQVLAGHRDVGFEENLPQAIYDLIASFQRAVVEMLFGRTFKAAEIYKPSCIMVSGGVACNRLLRTYFSEGFRRMQLPVYFPSPELSTDNAAMIAAAGFPKLVAGKFADMGLNADVNLKLA
jgi:N6-L-threonylcarbamoyladenine synthase